MGNKLQHGHLDGDDGGTLTVAAIPALAAQGRVVLSSGNLTTTSTTLEDITGASITITTSARPVRISFVGSVQESINSASVYFNVTIDGTTQLGSVGLDVGMDASGQSYHVCLDFLSASLSAGSHTFKVQWKVSGGTATLLSSSTRYSIFSVSEVY